MRNIKIGDEIVYKTFVLGIKRTSKVTGIEICRAGLKYGRPVHTCDLDKHYNVVISFEDHHWCYKNQLIEIKSA